LNWKILIDNKALMAINTAVFVSTHTSIQHVAQGKKCSGDAIGQEGEG